MTDCSVSVNVQTAPAAVTVGTAAVAVRPQSAPVAAAIATAPVAVHPQSSPAAVDVIAAAGASAYAIALANGFEGTEVEWLASLQGEDGAIGPEGAAMESSYVEVTSQRTTTSATLEDVTGGSTTITLGITGKIAVFMSGEAVSDGICTLGIAVNIDGTDHYETHTHLSGSSDAGTFSTVHRSGDLAPGTYTVKARFRRVSGSPKIPSIERLDMLVVSLQGAIGATGPEGPPDKTSRNLFILGL